MTVFMNTHSRAKPLIPKHVYTRRYVAHAQINEYTYTFVHKVAFNNFFKITNVDRKIKKKNTKQTKQQQKTPLKRIR